VKITNWGAKVQQILVPDRNGVLGDAALGYDTIDDLQAGLPSLGAFIGRYANRIGQAKFTLNAKNTSSRPTMGQTRSMAAARARVLSCSRPGRSTMRPCK
jgi:aldose 1-epimerase